MRALCSRHAPRTNHTKVGNSSNAPEEEQQEKEKEQHRRQRRGGTPIAVAYDRDHNTHLPCLRGGKAAHWAVIRGYCWARDGGGEDGGEGGCEADAASDQVSDRLLLLLSHGMSGRPFVCSHRELARSNAQLDGHHHHDGRWSFPPTYVIPEGGPRLAGLCIVPCL